MATTPVEFAAPEGLTLTTEFFDDGGDTIQSTVAATERTNNKGIYFANITDALIGLFNVRIRDAGDLTIGQYQVGMADDTVLRRLADPAISTGIAGGLFPVPIALKTDNSTFTVGTEETNDHTATHFQDGVDWVIRSVATALDVEVQILVPDPYKTRFITMKIEYDAMNTGTVEVQVFNFETTMWDTLDTLVPGATSATINALINPDLYTQGGLSDFRFLGVGLTDIRDFAIDFITDLAIQQDVQIFPTVGQIADAVWGEDLTPAQVADTAGDYQKRSVLSSGDGAVEVNLTIKDNLNNPLQDVEVWVTSDVLGQNVVAGTKETNVQGVVTFMLDPGLHYRWVQKNGFDFSNPQPFTVPAV